MIVAHSKKARKGRFYVGQFVSDDKKGQAGVVITRGLDGFDTYDDALDALENTPAKLSNVTYVLVEIKHEVRSKTSLIQIEP